MTALRVISICSGVDAFGLGLERAGMEIVAQVEKDPYCLKVLERHWPEVPKWHDLTTLDPRDLPAADVVAGGPPCQPVSAAGKGLAQADPRWLWPSVVRLVDVVRPRYVLMENPVSLLGRGFGDVLGALAEIGYDASWTCISAADVGAPHLRDRVWILAHPAGGGLGRKDEQGSGASWGGWPVLGGAPLADACGHRRREGQSQPAVRQWIPTPGRRGEPLGDTDRGPHPERPRLHDRGGHPEPAHTGRQRPQSTLGGVLDGAAAWLDRDRWPAPPGQPQHPWEPPRTVTPRTVPDRGRRVSACGNAVVVPVVELIGRAIVDHDAAQHGRRTA